MPDDVEDEDLIDELPPLGDLRVEDDGLLPDELGVGFGGEGGEDVGLDDSAGGLDEASLYVLELPPSEEEDDAGVDAIPVAELGDGEDEYGWTEDAGSAADERWDPADLDMPSMTPLGRDDGGEEGVEEVFDLGGGGDDAVPNLPPLEGGDEAEDEEGMELALTLVDERDADLPPALDEVYVQLEHEGPVYDAVLADRVWVLGDALYVGGERRSEASWEGRATSLHVEGELVLIGTEGGALRSERGGRGLARIEGLEGSIRFAGELGGPIWACCDAARLHKSEDGGATWSRPLLLTTVVALAVAARGVVALCAPKTAWSQLARSTDGGQRWTALDGPSLRRAKAGPTTFAVAVADEHVVVASDADPGGPFLSNDGGRSWLRVPALPPACALAVRREEDLAVYSAHTAAGRSAVVRHPTDGGEAGVVFECEGRVHRLIPGAPDELWVASDAGLHRVRREPER